MFVAPIEVLQGGSLNKVFGPRTDGPTRVDKLKIGLPRSELRVSENWPYSGAHAEIPRAEHEENGDQAGQDYLLPQGQGGGNFYSPASLTWASKMNVSTPCT